MAEIKMRISESDKMELDRMAKAHELRTTAYARSLMLRGLREANRKAVDGGRSP